MTGPPPSYVSIERQVLTCPLGVRFRDGATGRMIGDLQVVAYPPNRPLRRTVAVPNRSNIYAFHGLPGLRDFENQVNDDVRWRLESPLSPQTFVVEVSDPLDRFLPARFLVEAPTRVETLQEFENPPGLSQLRTETLYSGPARLVPGGCAAVRGQLFALSSGGSSDPPAAWLIGEISTRVLGATVSAVGAADKQGRLTILFPYPEPTNVSTGSPMNQVPQLLSDQSWPLSFRAWYEPGMATDDRLDLDRVRSMMAGSTIPVWEGDSPLNPFSGTTLVFGRELVIPPRSSGDVRPRGLWVG